MREVDRLRVLLRLQRAATERQRVRAERWKSRARAAEWGLRHMPRRRPSMREKQPPEGINGSAVEQHDPGTYWGPDGAQVSRDELLALLDVERSCRMIAVFSSQADEGRAIAALRRLDEARSV